MYIDTHAHLNFKAFADDYPEVIERAKKAGVEKIIVPGSNLATSQKAIEIANKYADCFSAVGFHPIHLEDEEFNESVFLELAKNEEVVAVGEAGLDYFHNAANADEQKKILVKQLNIAQAVAKPIILHCRDAYDDLITLLISEKLSVPGVIHCYVGNWQYAQKFLELGFYLSFTGIITFTKDMDIIETVEKCPLDRLMIETDAPYLAPQTHRGERNEPAFVAEVAKKIAEIKKISIEEVTRVTTQNTIDLFGLE